MNDHEPVITVVGLGRLGSCVAAAFSAAGFDVIGTDRNPQTVASFTDGTAPDWEPMLTDLCTLYPFRTTVDTAGAATESDVVLVVVPTPSGEDGKFDPSYVCAAVADVARGFKVRRRATYPVIGIVSTVMPGQTDGPIKDAIEAEGLTVGVDCGLAFVPSLIALGSVIENLRGPDVIMCGTDDDVAAAILHHLYSKMVRNGTRFERASAVDVEVAKLSINVFLGVKISYANTVARVCEQQPGADAANVLRIVGADKRVGSAFLKPGGSPSGPCLGRDQTAFGTIGGAVTTDLVRRSESELLDWIEGVCVKASDGADLFFGHEVAVLGLAYKPGIPVQLESFGCTVLNRLRPLFDVVCHDPAIRVNLQRVAQEDDLTAALDAAVVVVACAHDEYLRITPRRGQTVLDVWDVLEPAPGVVRPGVGPR